MRFEFVDEKGHGDSLLFLGFYALGSLAVAPVIGAGAISPPGELATDPRVIDRQARQLPLIVVGL